MSSHDDSRTNTNKKSVGGLRLLEWTGKVVPQGPLVSTAKFGWKQTWKILMQELAPQSKSGEYRRPMYTFRKRLGDGEFPVEKGMYVYKHAYRPLVDCQCHSCIAREFVPN